MTCPHCYSNSTIMIRFARAVIQLQGQSATCIAYLVHPSIVEHVAACHALLEHNRSDHTLASPAEITLKTSIRYIGALAPFPLSLRPTHDDELEEEGVF